MMSFVQMMLCVVSLTVWHLSMRYILVFFHYFYCLLLVIIVGQHTSKETYMVAAATYLELIHLISNLLAIQTLSS